MSRSVPRIIIAGTQSGTGKTSLSLALVASLRRRGLRIQTFKIGPDFLDPSYLTVASGRPCYNLDGWMTRKEYVLQLFSRTTKDADIAVIEGVMGLFDGSDPENSEGSTAEMARWLDAPVLLVVNVHGMARSLSAVVKGCVEFERDLKIAGVIANHSGSDHHKDWLTQSLKSASLPSLLGAIPRGAFPTLPSRHLGLITADPRNLPPKILEELADVLEQHLSVDAVMEIAKNASLLSIAEPSLEAKSRPKRVSIGVAHDRAFHFYYPDNLDELKKRGCDLTLFSPLKDRKLPEDIDALYFGGGYPEEYAETLAENREMQEAVRQFAKRGLPLYAECGGLMYLTQGIETTQGKRYPMAGLLPVWSRMLNRLKSLGYVEVTLTNNSLWGESGAVLRGHEFHYSELAGPLQDDPLWTPVYRIKRRRSEKIFTEGFQQNNVLASYVHLHWASQPPKRGDFYQPVWSRVMKQKMDFPKKESKRKSDPFIHRFLASALSGEEIEARSMERIEKEVPPHPFGPEEWQVVRRMIHTTGDFGLIDLVRFSPGAISHGIEALQSGRSLYVDSRMIQSGLSLKRLQSVYKGYQASDILCHVDDEEVFEKARQKRLPRSFFAVQKAKPILNRGLVVFGNSPVGLLELNRLIQEEEIRPALVIAMPVGFVHVIESKEELMSLDIPFIALSGRRGGSPLAVSVVHALCVIAAGQRDGLSAEPTALTKESGSLRDETIILMGHGSRVPGAGKDMKEVAQRLKDKYGYPRVEICFISRLGPHFPEIFEKCVNQGAKKVLAIPYFLHEGLHLLLDIPEMMQQEAKNFPHVKLMLGRSLGFDEGLVDLVERRIEESKDLCDVRDLPLPGREKYPIPPGQCEFVPMLPDEAAKYRK